MNAVAPQETTPLDRFKQLEREAEHTLASLRSYREYAQSRVLSACAVRDAVDVAIARLEAMEVKP
jgi:hypothetical protein